MCNYLVVLTLVLFSMAFMQCGDQNIQIVVNNTTPTPVAVSVLSQRFEITNDTGRYHSLEPIVIRSLIKLPSHFNIDACTQDTINDSQITDRGYPYFGRLSKCYDRIDTSSQSGIKVVFTLFPGEKFEIFRHRSKTDGLAGSFSLDALAFESTDFKIELNNRKDIFGGIKDFDYCSTCEMDIAELLHSN